MGAMAILLGARVSIAKLPERVSPAVIELVVLSLGVDT